MISLTQKMWHSLVEIITIADSCTDPHKTKVQIDARKWYTSKLAPKKYGDKIDLNNSNEPINLTVTIGGQRR